MTKPGDSGTKRPLRLATYNIEWFNALFDDRGRLLEDREFSARYKTTRADQLGAIAIVLTAMDADGVMIIEGPDQGSKRSTVKALEGFASKPSRVHPIVSSHSAKMERKLACHIVTRSFNGSAAVR